MTKEEFNNAVEKLVKMRDGLPNENEVVADKKFVDGLFDGLKNDKNFARLIYMMFWTSVHGVEELKEKINEDWDLPAYQEFLGVVDQYGHLWGEFIADAVYSFKVELNK